WSKILVSDPEYLIITQDDTGWIDLQGKDELTTVEINLVEIYKGGIKKN
ncbi:hypothetical protein HYV10_02990, partial [Candidatus Dependentiae bacterium]|nr:hypothetical protein [Candidatus Dependentiae bacterium]